MNAARDTWFMVGRQARNLMREPIWIALLVIQPLVWLTLYGQLFKGITNLPGGGFGTTSYITFLAPAIVVMNAFFGGTWSGMAMISDLDREVIPRFLATPVSRFALIASQVDARGTDRDDPGPDHPPDCAASRRAHSHRLRRAGSSCSPPPASSPPLSPHCPRQSRC